MKNATTREIKFRAWVPNLTSTKKMVYDGFSIDAKTGQGIWLGLDTYSFDESETVMQYTGLKDKRGTEVYEGDIVQYDTANGQNREEVIWDGLYGRFALRPINYTSNTELAFWVKNSEVIGNIHENPELLT